MKITATTSAATLATLLGAPSVAIIENKKFRKPYIVTLRNIGSQIAYVENNGVTATTTDGFQLPISGAVQSQITIETLSLADISVISAATTTDIRVIVN